MLWLTDFSFLFPKILISLLPNQFILTPIFFRKSVRFFISGSHAQFFKYVVPFAKLAAMITFSVAPTDIDGNLILVPISPFFASAKI